MPFDPATNSADFKFTFAKLHCPGLKHAVWCHLKPCDSIATQASRAGPLTAAVEGAELIGDQWSVLRTAVNCSRGALFVCQSQSFMFVIDFAGGYNANHFADADPNK